MVLFVFYILEIKNFILSLNKLINRHSIKFIITYYNQMYSHVDSSFQGIMYKPNFNENLNLDKKFMKKRK